MQTKTVNTPYPLIDSDPHFSRVVRYFRGSDYAVLAGATAAFPGGLYLMEYVDPTNLRKTSRIGRGPMIYGTVLGFVGGFLLAYQRSSFRFWGWTENEREQARDLAELSELARQSKPLYGESPQPEWVQKAAAGNSTFSALKFAAFPMFNFVHHKYHGTDPAKYGVKTEESSSQE
ncbi:hypothetical protein M422DRAFT_220502 [Sphaerobolus stellatus SS14]|nr:hypothetical protein M422DRAFT_220502 [Sphaerobolus stellatus SS14]